MAAKKILITGHNGYIGPLLVNLLQEKGYEIIGVDVNYFDDSCEFFPKGLKPFTQIIKDVRDIDTPDLEDVYAIAYLAAISNDPMGELNPKITEDINYNAAVRLARKAKSVGVKKFIYMSYTVLLEMTHLMKQPNLTLLQPTQNRKLRLNSS